MTSPDLIQLRPEDNVAVATRHLRAGAQVEVSGRRVTLLDPVQLGHKVTLAPIPEGDAIRKYGQIIGFASKTVEAGRHVHVHNCDAGAFDRDYSFASELPPPPPEDLEARSFRGFKRADGRVGTRNYVAIISTVNCSASTSRYIADRFPKDVLARYKNIDGILPITHKTGCGMQAGGLDHDRLNRVLAGFATHPNIGAYLIVGLGCEVAQTSTLVAEQKLVQIDGIADNSDESASQSPPVISIQDSGGIAKTVEAGIRALEELLPRADQVERVEVPASKLVLGLQCGGSDGNSGVTANPALGLASDAIVHRGGSAVLGETTEIYGAEHLLTQRAVSREVGEALIERIRWWEWYASVFGAEINNNPSPGNKAGGLTTIYEKSLGAVAKAGSTALTAVYEYAAQIDRPGMSVMDTPGYDPASLTGIVAGGANICVFTTGRGSVYGCKPAPCIKVATNSPLYERMESDMDINAGVILDGTPIEQVGRQIFDEILDVASGKVTKSEAQGVGEEEFSPWIVGPVL